MNHKTQEGIEGTLEDEWYEIPIDHCKNYLINRTGEVYSKRRVCIREHKGKDVRQPIGGYLIKPAITKTGYLIYSLTLNSKGKTFYAHELVAVTFLGERPEGYHICHCDGNSLNNHCANLRYDTPKGNASDRHVHGTSAVGSNNPSNKYSENTVAYVKYLLFIENKTQSEVSELVGIPNSTVGSIKQGRIWKHVLPYILP